MDHPRYSPETQKLNEKEREEERIRKLTQVKLYGLASLPIFTMTGSVFIFYDLLLIMGVELAVLVVLSILARKVVEDRRAKEIEGNEVIKEDAARNLVDDYKIEGYQLEETKAVTFNFVPVAVVFLLLIIMHCLLWIAGLSFSDRFYTLMPTAGPTGKWVYWLVFFFLFPTLYVAIESTFYYHCVLKNLEGNAIQGVIVGMLAALKASMVIIISLNYELVPSTWIIGIWIILNLIMGISAFSWGFMQGSIGRQLSYILILIGWVLLINNPWGLNQRPNKVYGFHPKNIFAK